MIQDLNLCRSSVFTLFIASFLQVWIHYCFKKTFSKYTTMLFSHWNWTTSILKPGKSTQQKSFSMFSCWTLICFFRLELKSTDHITVSTWLAPPSTRHPKTSWFDSIQRHSSQPTTYASHPNVAVTKMAIGFKPGGFLKVNCLVFIWNKMGEHNTYKRILGPRKCNHIQ